MQSNEKILEYQEACKALSEARKSRRYAVSFFAASAVFLIGLVYSRLATVDTNAYFSIAGIPLCVMSFLLLVKYTVTIKYTSEQLLKLEEAIGANVCSGSVHVGLSEGNFYIFIHALFGFIFVVSSVLFTQDAYDRHQLLFQSCGPYADVSPYNVEDSCPCGSYPPPTGTLNACPIPSSTGE